MASPHQPDLPEPAPEVHPESGDVRDYPLALDEEQPPLFRVRLAIWDVLCTVAMLITLFVLATTTSWPTRLFGYLDSVCPADTCAPVPFGVDYYIYPLTWAGIGGAFAAAGIGPFVSLLKGWYMSFWPVLAVGIVTLASIVGSTLTEFSARYWYY